MYATIARLFGLAVDLFYRIRHLGGEVPAEGPVIIVANHPNSLIDPVVVLGVANRRVRFLGKAPLFDMPVIGWIMRRMHVLPVFRAVDGADTAQNQQTFSAVFDALEAGSAIALFPEGISHHQPEMQPLKTGAARMALGIEARNDFELGLHVVPLGLSYRDKQHYRSHVATQVGEPIYIPAWAERFARDERQAARDLTDVIDEALRKVTVNLDAWEDLPLVEMAERIWRPGQGDRTTRIRALADGARQLRDRYPERMHGLRRRITAYAERLEQVGLEPEDLEKRFSPGLAARFVVRNAVALFVGMPVALIGAVAYAVPFHAVPLAALIMRPPVDVSATVKLLASMLFYPLWHFLLVGYGTYLFGWQIAVPVGTVLPLCGIYSQHFLERRQAALHDLALFLTMPSRHAARRQLEREREALADEMEALAAAVRQD